MILPLLGLAFFQAPWFLFGLSAIGIPILIHLFYRTRYRRVMWGAMRFLRLSIEQTSRRLRFQELLLLLLRICVLALLALAFARFKPTTATLIGSGPIDAVFVIDNSMSMDGKDGPLTRLERAKESALAILENLPTNSTVQVIACSGSAQLIGPADPSNLAYARQLITDLPIHHQSTDLYLGVGEAEKALERGRNPNRELYLFTDHQRQGWERQLPQLKQKLEAMHSNTSIYCIRCGKTVPANVTIRGIIPGTAIPHAGARTAFAVLVKNTSSQEVHDIRVSLMVNGTNEDGDSRVLKSLRPGETGSVALTGRLPAGGHQLISAHLEQDELSADNHLDRVLIVRDRVRVLVVDGAYDPVERSRSASFHLVTALRPARVADWEKYPVLPQVIVPTQAHPTQLDYADVCILVNVPMELVGTPEGLPAEFMDRLTPFVKDGRKLVVFGGNRVNAHAYNEIFGKKFGLLPAPLTAVHADEPLAESKPGDRRKRAIDTDSADLFAFPKFRNEPIYEGLKEVSIRQVLGIDESGLQASEDEKGGRVLLRLTDGRAAMVERALGLGRVLFFATAVDNLEGEKSWSDLPHAGLFVPFVQEMLAYLLHGQDSNNNVTAGEPLVPAAPLPVTTGGSLAANTSYVLQHPDGKVDPYYPNAKASLPTMAAGVYRIGLRKRAAELAMDGLGTPYAITPDFRELEDLASLSDEEIDQRLGFSPHHLLAGSDPSMFLGSERTKGDWTKPLLWWLLLLVMAEAAFAWWIGRRW